MMDSNFASLGSPLLARKGGAKPAMRRLSGAIPADKNVENQLNDLGWNDMGDAEISADAGLDEESVEYDARAVEADVTDIDRASGRNHIYKKNESVNPVVRKQQEALADTFASDTNQSSQNDQSAPEKAPSNLAVKAEKKVAFTLRLDRERHLKLRLVSAMRGISAQRIVTEVIDEMFNEINEIETLIAQIRQD